MRFKDCFEIETAGIAISKQPFKKSGKNETTRNTKQVLQFPSNTTITRELIQWVPSDVPFIKPSQFTD